MNTASGRPARRAEVIVVGGGPAGSATAFFLARAGIDVLVLDRAAFPRDKPCAESLSPQASRLLDELGVLSTLEMHGAQLTGMRVRAPNGATIVGEFAAAHGFRGFRDRGLAIRRTILDATLLAAARGAGARVAEQVTVRDLIHDHRRRVIGVQASDSEGPRAYEAGLIVGADGLRSVIGRRAGLIRAGPWPRRVALVTHATGIAGIESHGELHVGPRGTGYVGFANVGAGVTNVALVLPVSRAPELKGDADGFFSRWLSAQSHLVPRLHQMQQLHPVTPFGPFNTRSRRAWVPGLALVGDAADFYDPFTGEGIYAALRGAEVLAPYLAHAVRSPGDADLALAAYDRARRHEFRGKWHLERLIGTAVEWPALLNVAARSLARRRDLADLLVGVTGDFVPAAEVLRPSFVLRLLLPARQPARTGTERHPRAPSIP